jgi:hypothetical protein
MIYTTLYGLWRECAPSHIHYLVILLLLCTGTVIMDPYACGLASWFGQCVEHAYALLY